MEKSSHRIASNRFSQAVSRNLLTLRLHVIRFRSAFNENVLLSLPCPTPCERVRIQRDRQWKHTAVHFTGAKSISCLQAFYIFIFIFSARISDFFSLISLRVSEWVSGVFVFPLPLDAIVPHNPKPFEIWLAVWCSVPSDGTTVGVEVDGLKTCKLVRVWQSFWVRLKACCDAYILSGHQHPSIPCAYSSDDLCAK